MTAERDILRKKSLKHLGHFDPGLLVVTFALLLFGLMSVYTATAHQALEETGNSLSLLIKQLIACGLGLFLMFAAARFPFTRWGALALPLALVSIGLLLMTMAFGTTANGSERWISLPFGFQFQPSDIAKISAILLLAKATSQKRWGVYISHLALVGLMIILILQQPNLSVALILTLLSASFVFISGFPLLLLVMAAPPFFWLLYQKIRHTEYQWRRIVGWLNPWKDPMDTGYNLIQSYYAIGSGGILGRGLGHSVQKLYYLPFQHTDFIFAVICEELGFLGAAIVLGFYGILAWRGFHVALSCNHLFGQKLAFGLTFAIILQALINICVTVGLMPVTGVTLPLISYGGTSMVTTLVMVGVLLNISRHVSRQEIEAEHFNPEGDAFRGLPV